MSNGERWSVVHGDCRDVMRGMGESTVDAVVCDPPYGLSFMGKEWDHGVPGVEFWTEALRVAKPGAHLLAFGGTRTYHRLACAIEDAGWEVRDCVMWVYGSGFPKSLDVSKAIDKAAGAEREVVGPKVTGEGHITNRKNGTNNYGTFRIAQDGIDMLTAPATDAARQWSGWGTALKPAWEPVIVARKPLVGTVAENVMQHGTGALNIDGSRIGISEDDPIRAAVWTSRASQVRPGTVGFVTSNKDGDQQPAMSNPAGRWPANVIHDGSEEVVGLFPESKDGVAGKRSGVAHVTLHGLAARDEEWGGYGGSGSAARFFYCAKASRADREEGNHHATVKPTELMRYLCRLVTPPGGLVLDPFCGSGSTGKAAMLEGFRFVGIEKEAEYVEIARARVRHAEADAGLFPH